MAKNARGLTLELTALVTRLTNYLHKRPRVRYDLTQYTCTILKCRFWLGQAYILPLNVYVVLNHRFWDGLNYLIGAWISCYFFFICSVGRMIKKPLSTTRSPAQPTATMPTITLHLRRGRVPGYTCPQTRSANPTWRGSSTGSNGVSPFSSYCLWIINDGSVVVVLVLHSG